jgi:hypothetical protein
VLEVWRKRIGCGLYTHMCYFLICSKIAEIRDQVLVREGVDGVRKVPGDK